MGPEEFERLRLLQMEMDLHLRQSQREVCFLCGEAEHDPGCLLYRDRS